MANISFNIGQSQLGPVSAAVAQAQSFINPVITALQQAIAAAGGGNVTLSSALLQPILVNLNTAANLLAQAPGVQQQSAAISVGGMLVAAMAQPSAQARLASLMAVINAIQSLLMQAQAMGGQVLVSPSGVQQLVSQLQAVVSGVIPQGAMTLSPVTPSPLFALANVQGLATGM